ncbi:MAG: 50S ribosomal protein L11 methyltransferase [Gammaproteobacteria bacterium]
MSWHQITVITNENTAPLLADAFSELGAVSVTYMDAEDEPVYEPAIGETKIWSHTEVIALYESNANPEAIAKEIGERFLPADLHNWRVELIEDQEWERAWMDYYHPMKFADKLWVCPTDQERHEAGTVCLILDPGLAFGTGTHPTTALCLEWLACHDLAGKTVIDYGCGSGILAVAAVLLGATAAHAVDIDPQALTATADNAQKNKVADRIYCYLPEQLPPLPADIVLANILAKPLCDLKDTICSLLVSGGQLVLSGILSDQAESVIDAYRSRIEFDQPVQQEDWIRLAGIKR